MWRRLHRRPFIIRLIDTKCYVGSAGSPLLRKLALERSWRRAALEAWESTRMDPLGGACKVVDWAVF
jgi:hypothetical protein